MIFTTNQFFKKFWNRQISIRNNYDSEFVSNAGEGIGLKNIQKRLQIIYERNYAFETHDDGKEFQAIMRLPKIDLDNYGSKI